MSGTMTNFRDALSNMAHAVFSQIGFQNYKMEVSQLATQPNEFYVTISIPLKRDVMLIDLSHEKAAELFEPIIDGFTNSSLLKERTAELTKQILALRKKCDEQDKLIRQLVPFKNFHELAKDLIHDAKRITYAERFTSPEEKKD